MTDRRANLLTAQMILIINGGWALAVAALGHRLAVLNLGAAVVAAGYLTLRRGDA